MKTTPSDTSTSASDSIVVTLPEAARLLATNRRTVEREIVAGRLRVLRFSTGRVRVRRTEIARYCELAETEYAAARDARETSEAAR